MVWQRMFVGQSWLEFGFPSGMLGSLLPPRVPSFAVKKPLARVPSSCTGLSLRGSRLFQPHTASSVNFTDTMSLQHNSVMLLNAYYADAACSINLFLGEATAHLPQAPSSSLQHPRKARGRDHDLYVHLGAKQQAFSPYRHLLE